MLIARIRVDPMGKPTMSSSDRWAKRPVVVSYFEQRAAINQYMSMVGVFSGYTRAEKLKPGSYFVVFKMPFPASYSKKKRAELLGSPHTLKPDLDNLLKAFNDAVYQNREGGDAHVWCDLSAKIWAEEGAIEIYSLDVGGLIYAQLEK